MAGMKLYPLEANDPRQLGPYRLLRRIATGGMGRIYLARPDGAGGDTGGGARGAGPTGTFVDTGLVAVKTLLAEGVVSKPDWDRFAREVELAERVDSAHTVRVLDADAQAERPWLAIDFIPAPGLSELVVRGGALEADAVRWIGAGAARALAELHGVGVVHRDVKPQNILLPLDGPRIIDFGISHAHDQTSTTMTLGTFAFTSPEQARGTKSTAASDVYSLGATLFYLAVGRAPYQQTDHPIGQLALVQSCTLELEGLPAELESLILPCLAAKPDARPAPTDVLRDCLSELGELSALGGLGEADVARVGGERWLPAEWVSLIGEYEAQGRQLRGGQVDFGLADALTVTAPPTDEEVRQQLEVLRGQREAAARAQAEQLAEAEERERRQREERGRKERARKEKEREKEKERKERARKERQRKEKEAARKAAAAASAAASAQGPAKAPTSAKPVTPASAPSPAKPPANSGSSQGWGALLITALIVGLLIWQPWDKDDSKEPTGSATPSATPSYTSGTTTGVTSGSGSSGSGLGDSDTGTDDSGSGTDPDTSAPEPEPEPEPDPTEAAFAAVSAGDCLTVTDTGYGGLSKYEWSEDEPTTTACGGPGTRVEVTGTSGSCPSGAGKTSWSYGSTTLCLSGRWETGSCLLAQHSGDEISSVGLLTSVNCSDSKVPNAYNEILYVKAVYRATAGAGADSCRNGQYDTTSYWSTKVDNGATMLCLMAYD